MLIRLDLGLIAVNKNFRKQSTTHFRQDFSKRYD